MYIIGAGGHAKVIYEILTRTDYCVEGFYDDHKEGVLCEKPILQPISSVPTSCDAIIGIGNNRTRKSIAKNNPKLNFVTALHISASIDRTSSFGSGTVVMRSVAVNADVKIGKHCIVNTSASIDHDCKVADFVHISPNTTLCGDVHIGEGTHVGAGVTVLPGIKIGKWCTIGAGSVVTQDVPDNTCVLGVPARPDIRTKEGIHIVGAGGFGKEVKAMLKRCGYRFSSFHDDNKYTSSIQAIEELGADDKVVIAIGSSAKRIEFFNRIGDTYSYPKLVSQDAIFSEASRIKIGKGTIICAGSILTTDIEIGDFGLINLNCTIGHDSVLEDFVSLMPSVNVGGNVHIEKGAYIGTGVSILPGIRIGQHSIVGAGAVVTTDIPAYSKVKGIPAK